MKLEWMGEYRDIIEKLIRFSNGYSSVLHKKQYLGTDIAISFAQIQVVEYILENESYMQNMSKIAYRLGISYSTFSKLANSLVEMGLLQKFNIRGNRKDIIIQATDYGKDQYIKYSKFMSEIWIKRIAQAGDAIPKGIFAVCRRNARCEKCSSEPGRRKFRQEVGFSEDR
ncbi:MAG: hypothetical protein R2912_10385 [Eubacteriales bacterium]